ncbi:Protein of unknown function (DUF674 [Striga hermonthica]|uniref:DUF674 domain-containing protein n=1 Tax=Striga hermonthica TaxID=68872 RepID=A0A9N7NW29_STRHE|nr:Protein of unknown function (DUF674 [Striga hermonthica]
MAKSSVSMKLLIDTKAKRVLFAEAGKDSVDFLFYIISLPVANIVNLMVMGKQGMVGSLGNLYQSIENLNETYMQPNQNKDTLLKPAHSVSCSSVPLLAIGAAPTVKKLYTCPKNCISVTEDTAAVCHGCNCKMTVLMEYVAPPAVQKESGPEGGFVKGVVTYMVMDDLTVSPMSTISSITLLNKFNVKEVGALEEKVVSFGMTEVVKLLKASLETKNVLTHVFLNRTA